MRRALAFGTVDPPEPKPAADVRLSPTHFARIGDDAVSADKLAWVRPPDVAVRMLDVTTFGDAHRKFVLATPFGGDE